MDIAVVGMGCLYPGAAHPADLWNNALDAADLIRPIPKRDSYWSPEDFFDPRPGTADKTYSRVGGQIPDTSFDPKAFGIPPITLEAVSQVQLLSLHVAREALADAGMLGTPDAPAPDLGAVGVVLGVAGVGATSIDLGTRLDAPNWRKVMNRAGLHGAALDALVGRIKDLYVGWREECFSGFLGNVVAGRISSRFDLRGTNMTVDAACAGSLAAVKVAMAELRDGSCDAVLTGGAALENSVFSYICFTSLQAVSPSGTCRAYDMAADGMLMGDGIGMVVLKRLEDARAAGDRIYGLIKNVGASADGRRTSIYTPSLDGQVAGCRRAYRNLTFGPEAVGLVEGHGTGTILGDKIELATLKEVFGGAGPHRVALGSIKAQFGHTRAASGTAALIKTVLALRHGVLPPAVHVTRPHEELTHGDHPCYLTTRPRPWIDGGAPRRAAVNGFGFGGTNFHMVLEAFDDGRPYRMTRAPQPLVHAADDRAGLVAWCRDTADGGPAAVAAHAAAARDAAPAEGAHRLFVLLPPDPADAGNLLRGVAAQLEGFAGDHLETPYCIYRAAPLPGRTIVVLHDLGAPNPWLGADLACAFAEARHVMGLWDDALAARDLAPLHTRLFPRAFSPEADAPLAAPYDRLAHLAWTAAHLAVLHTLGLAPDAVLGAGDNVLTALHLAGCLTDETYATLSLAPPEARAALAADLDLQAPRIPVYTDTQAAPATTVDAVRAMLVPPEEAPAISARLHALGDAGFTRLLQVGSAPVPKAGRILTTPHAAAEVIPTPEGDLVGLWRAVGLLHTAGVALRCSDPYAAPPVPAPSEPSPPAVTLDGGIYLSEQTRARRRYVLEEAPPIPELVPKVPATETKQPQISFGGDALQGALGESLKARIRQGLQAATGLPVAAEVEAAPAEGAIPPPTTAADTPVKPARGAASAPAPAPPTAPGAEFAVHDLHARYQDNQAHYLRLLDKALSDTPSEHTLDLLARNQELYQANYRRYLDMVAPNPTAPADDASVPPPVPPPTAPAAADPPPESTPAPSDGPTDLDLEAADDALRRGWSEAGVGGSAAVLAELQTRAAEAPPLPEPEEIERRLKEIVSEKTGYPIEVLEPDMDLETDLGIDSIRRIEIMSVMQEEFPSLVTGITDLEELRTLGGIIAVIERAVDAERRGVPLPELNPEQLAKLTAQLPAGLGEAARAGTLGAAAQAFADLIPGGGDPLPIHAHPIVPVALPVAARHPLPPDLHLLVVDGGDALTDTLTDLLESRGARVTLLRLHDLIPYLDTDPPDALCINQDDGGDLADVLQPFLENTRISGLLHLHPASDPVRPWPERFQDRDLTLCRLVFRICTLLSASAKTAAARPWFFGAVVRGDGRLGFGETPYPVVPAAFHGLAKTLRFEWPGSICKALDIDAALPDALAADMVLEELCATDHTLTDIGRTADTRTTTRPIPPATAEASVATPDADDVFVVTGGGRGITAACVVAMAQAYHCKFILIGTTPEPTEDRPSSPAQDEIAETLARIMAAGGTAIYRAADVTRLNQLRRALDPMPEWGAVTGLIHGAGTIADREIGDKTMADYDAVFGPKVLGLRNLLRVLAMEPLRHVRLFGSVAGYFGNRGQADYAMANAVLERFSLTAPPAANPAGNRTLIWGPWNGGMMPPGLRLAARSLVGLIDMEEGANLFRADWQTAPAAQVLLAGTDTPPGLRFIQRLQPFEAMLTTRPEAHPALDGYTLFGEPVLPDACVLGWAARTCDARVPGLLLYRISEIKLFKRARPDAHGFLHLKVTPTDKGKNTVHFEITVLASGDDGREACLLTARLHYGPKAPAAQIAQGMQPDARIREEGTALYDDPDFQPGDGFRGLRHITTFDRLRLQAHAVVPAAACDSAFHAARLNPAALDLQLHAVARWFRHFCFQTPIVTEIQSLEIVAPPAPGDAFTVLGVCDTQTKTTARMELFVVDDAGRTLTKWTRLSLAGRTPTPEGS